MRTLLVSLLALALLGAGAASVADAAAPAGVVRDPHTGLWGAADCLGIPVIPCCIPSTSICIV